MLGRDNDVTELLQTLTQHATAMHEQASSIASLATGLKVNGVIFSGTIKIGPSGLHTVRARANFASATVLPTGADVTISVGGGAERAPTQGEGVFPIPGDIERTVAVAGNVLYIYGTPNAHVAVTLWVRPQPPEGASLHPYRVDCPAGPQRIAAAAVTTELAAANPERSGLTVYNESSAVLYLALAPTAGLAAYTVQIPGSAFYELQGVPLYRGIVSGIWAAGIGAAQVTELV